MQQLSVSALSVARVAELFLFNKYCLGLVAVASVWAFGSLRAYCRDLFTNVNGSS